MITDKAVESKNEHNRTSVLRQLTALQTMSSEEIDNKWRDLYGSEPPRYKKTFLQRRLAFRIQELFFGGVEPPVRDKFQELAAHDPSATRLERPRTILNDGKVLPGTRFIRVWNGKIYETIARDDGFEFNGQIYRSLTAIATAITGTKWNGRKWWGLPDSKKSSAQ